MEGRERWKGDGNCILEPRVEVCIYLKKGRDWGEKGRSRKKEGGVEMYCDLRKYCRLTDEKCIEVRETERKMRLREL